MPTRIIMHSVCHVFYYVNGNWIGSSFFFSCLPCLYGNQEIRLTDVPAILMAAPSHQSFLAILFLCRTSLSLYLPHSPLPPSPLLLSAPALDVFSPRKRRQFPYRITTRIRWPGFDSQSVLHPQPHHHKWKCICVRACVHACFVQMWASSLPGENAARLQCVLLVIVAAVCQTNCTDEGK